MNDERRNFIKLSTTMATGILVAGTFSGCFDTYGEINSSIQTSNDDRNDIRFLVLSYAMLAPNPHNKQPWSIHLKDKLSFDLYVDTKRTLPHTDPPPFLDKYILDKVLFWRI